MSTEMTGNVQSINVDRVFDSYEIAKFKQGSTWNKLVITITDQGLPYNLETNENIIYRLQGATPDNRFIFKDATSIHDNVLEFDNINEYTTCVSGLCLNVSVSIWNNADLKLDVLLQDIIIKIEKNSFYTSNIIDSDQMSSLNNIILKADEEIQKCVNATTACITATTNCTNKINEFDSDEETRKSNELTRQSNESTRQTQETTRESQETTRQSNESTRQSNETTRQTNTQTAITNCETATQNANDAVDSISELVETKVGINDASINTAQGWSSSKINTEVTAKVDKTSILNSLNGTDNTQVLGATQGKILKDSIDTINTKMGTVGSTDLQTQINTMKSNFVNIKDYGAVGDGITDDTTAIQNAINQTISDTIIVPAGKYHTTQSIICRTGIRVVGEGRNTAEFLNSFATGTFTLADNVFFENLNFETDNNVDGYAFVGDSTFAVNFKAVDSLGGWFNNTRSKFLKLTGAWHTLLMYDCTIDCGTLNGYAVELVGDNNWNLHRDCMIRNVFIDTWYATGDNSGSIYCENCYGIKISNSLLRSTNNAINVKLTLTPTENACTCDLESCSITDGKVSIDANVIFNNYVSYVPNVVNNGIYKYYDTTIQAVKTIMGSSNFSWVNQNDAICNSKDNGTFELLIPVNQSGANGINFAGRCVDIPTSNYAVTTCIDFIPISKKYTKYGMGITDANNKLVFFGIVTNVDNTQSLGVIKYSDMTTYNSDYGIIPINIGSKIWLRINKDATNYTFSTSVDGITWQIVYVAPISTFYIITPTKIGVFEDNENAEGVSFMSNMRVSNFEVIEIN